MNPDDWALSEIVSARGSEPREGAVTLDDLAAAFGLTEILVEAPH